MRNRGCTGEKSFLQAHARYTKTWADVTPEINKIGRAQSLAVLIEEPPRAEHGGVPIDRLPEAERPQNAHAIGGQIDPCPNRWPRGAAFDDLWDVALTVKRCAKRKAADAAANDQDAIHVSHAALLA
jgi:hypothetical protein